METVLENLRASIQRPDQTLGRKHLREMFILPALQQVIGSAIEKCSDGLSSGAKVLDIGCGRQPYRSFLESLNFSYFSFDVTQNESNTVQFLGQIDGPLPQSLIDAGPFDLILLTEVLEHVLNAETCFENLSKLLSRDGKLIITCPFFYPLHEKPFDFWRPTSFAITELSHKHGLNILERNQLGTSVDCLGLLVGHLLETMHYLTPSNFFQRVVLSVKQRFLRGFLQFQHLLIRKGFLNSNFSRDTDFYITNYFLLSHQK